MVYDKLEATPDIAFHTGSRPSSSSASGRTRNRPSTNSDWQSRTDGEWAANLLQTLRAFCRSSKSNTSEGQKPSPVPPPTNLPFPSEDDYRAGALVTHRLRMTTRPVFTVPVSASAGRVESSLSAPPRTNFDQAG